MQQLFQTCAYATQKFLFEVCNDMTKRRFMDSLFEQSSRGGSFPHGWSPQRDYVEREDAVRFPLLGCHE